MSDQITKLGQQLFAQGLCDARGVAFVCTARETPYGVVGMVLLTVKENTLRIYEQTFKGVGDLLGKVPLREIENLKLKADVLHMLLPGDTFSFEWQGGRFRFTNTGKLTYQAEAIRAEAAKGKEA